MLMSEPWKYKSTLEGTRFTVLFKDQSFPVNMKLIGGFSVYNALAAITFALAEKIPVPVIQQVLANIEGFPAGF